MDEQRSLTDDRSPDLETYVEWGYRRPDGREVWVGDYGTDGSWTAWQPDLGIDAIDIDANTTAADIAKRLIPGCVVLSRPVTVTRGPVEEQPVAPAREAGR